MYVLGGILKSPAKFHAIVLSITINVTEIRPPLSPRPGPDALTFFTDGQSWQTRHQLEAKTISDSNTVRDWSQR